jgi:tRNA threonylcarbamoyladenosine biosynthesis protein TsaE
VTSVPGSDRQRVLSTAEETEALGAALALSRPSDATLKVIYLTGDLGAGKTTLTRGFLHAIGIAGTVRSPTYTLVESYKVGATTYVHLDLYRLNEPSELENLGLRDWATPAHVWLIEWPERGGARLPPADLVVRLTAGAGTNSAHTAVIVGETEAGQRWLGALNAAGES